MSGGRDMRVTQGMSSDRGRGASQVEDTKHLNIKGILDHLHSCYLRSRRGWWKYSRSPAIATDTETGLGGTATIGPPFLKDSFAIFNKSSLILIELFLTILP